MAGQRHIIVTRPAVEAAVWVQAMQKIGFNAEALPLIDIAGVSEPQHVQALSEAWHKLPSYAACMFVSGNAVQYFFEHKAAAAQSIAAQQAIENIAKNTTLDALSSTLRWLAPGPGTAASLIAAGVSASQIDAPRAEAPQFDSEALWDVIGARDWRCSRVLLVRGLAQTGSTGQATSQGRDWLVRQLQQAGASVDVVASYQRQVPVFDAGQLQWARTALTDGSIWIFSSSEAVSNLAGLMATMPASSRAGVSAVVTHPRIAQVAKALGWRNVIESRPMLGDVAAALALLQASAGENRQARP